ncbi:hypothetical protein PROFUN_01252 [Planoprotostelium fungivorum]|uniref:Uncharacterized protein n=1 Tax=Planoprotostelium fungivorum TaxID=1890364 RepID=A0A2P6NZP2_9EUKA|nr:hypothetical protein PROFUN_01252 [Planoprotostelium fungivorum]
METLYNTLHNVAERVGLAAPADHETQEIVSSPSIDTTSIMQQEQATQLRETPQEPLQKLEADLERIRMSNAALVTEIGHVEPSASSLGTPMEQEPVERLQSELVKVQLRHVAAAPSQSGASIVVEPVEVLQVTPAREVLETRGKIIEAPNVDYEKIEKGVVVQEIVHPTEQIEIQPIIHREREQLDVKQITEHLHETRIQPTNVEEKVAAPETRQTIVERSVIPENIVKARREVLETIHTQHMNEPIVEETIKKKVIEEVQPVLNLDVYEPTVVKTTLPIYEKVVEKARVFKEERDIPESNSAQKITTYESLAHRDAPGSIKSLTGASQGSPQLSTIRFEFNVDKLQRQEGKQH